MITLGAGMVKSRKPKTIRSVAELRLRISDKPNYWARLLTVRLALRLLPLTFGGANSSSGERLVLRVFRASFISWSLTFHEKLSRVGFALNEARYAAGAALEAADGTRHAGSHVAGRVAAFAADTVAPKISRSRTDLVRAAQTIGILPEAAEIWSSLSADIFWLERAKQPEKLMHQPLWLDDVRGDSRYSANLPMWVRDPFDVLAKKQSEGTDWRPLIAWYRAILPNGSNFMPRSLFGEDVDLHLATMNEEFWAQKPKSVLKGIAEIVGLPGLAPRPQAQTMKEFIVDMLTRENRVVPLKDIYSRFHESEFEVDHASIRGRVNSLVYEDRIRRVEKGKYASVNYLEMEGGIFAPINGAPPSVPKIRAAAIEPIWRDGKLRLPTAQLLSDLDDPVLVAALGALRDELVELAADCDETQNIDKRPAEYLRRLATKIPDGAPSQQMLFRLGHAYEYLESFTKITDSEWPDFLGSRYRKLILQYDRTVRQFPQWRSFVRNAAEHHLTVEQVAEVPQIAGAIVSALKSDDAKDVVDSEIPDSLESVSRPVVDWDEALQAGQEQLAEDVLESINNVLKRISEIALELKESGVDPVRAWVKSTGQGSVHSYAEEAKKSIVEEASKFGKATGPAVGRLIKRLAKGTFYGGTGGVGGVLILKRLFALYPDTFGWLEPVLRFLNLLF